MPIFQSFKTLRFRLTLMYVIIFGVVQTALSLILNLGREQYLRKDFDRLLVERADVIVDGIIRQGDLFTNAGAGNELPQLQNGSISPGWFCEIHLTDPVGRTIKSDSLRLVDLPLSEESRSTSQRQGPVLETFSGNWVENLLGNPAGEIRLLTVYVNTAKQGPFYLQVARTLEPLNRVLGEFRHTIFLFLGISLTAAGIASWLLARQSFAPIQEIVSQAQHITARRLDLRIKAPAGDRDIAEMVTVINNMLDRLEATFTSQDRLLSDVAHELKTPIAVLRSEAQRLGRKMTTLDDHARFAHDVSQEMGQMSDIVDSFLAFARVEGRNSDMASDDVYIPDLILDAVRHCQPVAKAREIRLLPKLPTPDNGAPELILKGNANLLRIMIENLLRNAKKYSPPRSVVEIEVATNDGSAEIKIRDNGTGIPPGDLSKVFDRGYRVPRTGSNIKGVGLGLAIAQSIATLHEGVITVANRLEGGCIFTIRLPLASSASEPHGQG